MLQSPLFRGSSLVNDLNELNSPGNDSMVQVSKPPEDYYRQGWNALKNKWPAAALWYFNQAIEAVMGDPRYYYGRSFALECLERFSEALADIEQALHLNGKKGQLLIESSLVDLRVRRIQIYINQPNKQWSSAELMDMLRQLVDEEPSLESLLSPSTAWPSMNTPPSTPGFPPGFGPFGDSGLSCTPKKRAGSIASCRFSSSTMEFSSTPISQPRSSISASPLSLNGGSNASLTAYDENKPPNQQVMMSTPLRPRLPFGQLTQGIASPFPGKIDLNDGDLREITNPLGLKALFVRNVNRTVRQEDLLPIFQRFGRVTKFRHFNEKSRSAFVCYDSAEAALAAMRGLFNFRDQRLCYDPTISWMFRFAPGDDQTDQQFKNSNVARQLVEAAGECYDWRVGDPCQRAPCLLRHVSVNHNRDSKSSDAHIKRYR